MKKKIVDFIKSHAGATFIELERIEGFKGEKAMTFQAPHQNIILWPRCSDEAIDAINDLFVSGSIHWRPTSFLTYLADGGGPTLPLAKKFFEYKKPHWLPIAWYPGELPAIKKFSSQAGKG